VEELIEEYNSKGRNVAAMIVEPIQSEGGQHYNIIKFTNGCYFLCTQVIIMLHLVSSDNCGEFAKRYVMLLRLCGSISLKMLQI